MASAKETVAGIIGVSVLAKSPRARRALVGLLRQGGRTMGPWGLAAWLAYEGYVRRDQIRTVANEIAERLPPAVPGQGGDPGFRAGSSAYADPAGPQGLDIGSFFTEGPIRHPSQLFTDAELAAQRRRGKRRRGKVKTKFNEAVGFVFKTLKKNAPKMKRQTAFSKATKIASKANPFTKSRIGKGATTTKKLARKVRKKYWNTKKRLKR
jgi:hypothetical protein